MLLALLACNNKANAQYGPPCSTQVTESWLKLSYDQLKISGFAEIKCNGGVRGECYKRNVQFDVWAWNGNTWVRIYTILKKSTRTPDCGDTFLFSETIYLTFGVYYYVTMDGYLDDGTDLFYYGVFNY